MTFNEGIADRVIRVMGGIVLSYMTWLTWPEAVTISTATGIMSLFLLVASIEVIVTGLLGWSPLYALFDYSTKEPINS